MLALPKIKTTFWWFLFCPSPTGCARVPTLVRMHHMKTQFSWASPTGTPKNTQHFLSSANMARHCGRHCAGNQYCRRYRNQVPSQPCIAPKHTNLHQAHKTNPTPQEQCKIPKNKVFNPMICRYTFWFRQIQNRHTADLFHQHNRRRIHKIIQQKCRRCRIPHKYTHRGQHNNHRHNQHIWIQFAPPPSSKCPRRNNRKDCKYRCKNPQI